jgi:Flp pilus assembly protein protease CpaA
VNRWLTGALMLVFGGILAFGAGHADVSLLTATADWRQAPRAIPIIFLALVRTGCHASVALSSGWPGLVDSILVVQGFRPVAQPHMQLPARWAMPNAGRASCCALLQLVQGGTAAPRPHAALWCWQPAK